MKRASLRAHMATRFTTRPSKYKNGSERAVPSRLGRRGSRLGVSAVPCFSPEQTLELMGNKSPGLKNEPHRSHNEARLECADFLRVSALARQRRSPWSAS